MKHGYADQRTLPVYIDAEIDDSGLDVYERAVYLTIARRSGATATFYESVPNMAARLGIGVTKAREALRALEGYGVIARTERVGETSVYVLTDRSAGWRLPDRREKTPPPGGGVPHRLAAPTPPPGGAKGTPLKLLPLKVKPSPTPPKQTAKTDDLPDGIDRDAWADYERHRREKRVSLTPTARARLLAKLAKADPVDANAALRESVENGWTGVFPDRRAGDRRTSPAAYAEDVTTDDLLSGPLEGRRR